MDPEEAAESLSAELELLSAMFGDDVKIDEASTSVTVLLRPSECEDVVKRRFVEATVKLAACIEHGYPEKPASATLVRTRGLVDDEEAALLAAVRARAADAAEHGEPSLYGMLEVAQEQLTAFNTGGTCPICREPLADGACFLTDACFHSFHVECLGAWWHACKEAGGGKASGGASGDTNNNGGGGAAALSSAAKAAEAAAASLRTKVVDQNERLEALSARLAQLKLIVDPPPPPSELRKLNEESKEASAELARLESRASKAERKATEAAEAAATAKEDEQTAASEAPLPCPVCRADVSVASLKAGGVVNVAVCVEVASASMQLTDEQTKAQREREELWRRQQQRQEHGGGASPAEPPPQQQEPAAVATMPPGLEEPSSRGRGRGGGKGGKGGGGKGGGKGGRGRGRQQQAAPVAIS